MRANSQEEPGVAERSDKYSNLTLGLKLRCASLMHLDRVPFAVDLQKPRTGQKTFTKVEVLLDSALLATYTGHGDVRTCPGTRAQEGRSERRAVLSSEHTKRSSATARSVSPYAPVSPSWNSASGPAIHVRHLCQWNTRTRTRGMSGFTVPSPRPHATL